MWDALKRFVRKRAIETLGLALIIAAIGFGAALLTYTPADPSWNVAGPGPVRNLMGAPGAVAADLGYQLFGLGAFLVLLPLLVWGAWLIRTHHIDYPLRRGAAWAGSVVFFVLMASALPPLQAWPLPGGMGGFAGDSLAVPVIAGVQALGVGSARAAAYGVTLGAGLATLICLSLAAGIGPRRVTEAFHGMVETLRRISRVFDAFATAVGRMGSAVAGLFRWVRMPRLPRFSLPGLRLGRRKAGHETRTRNAAIDDEDRIEPVLDDPDALPEPETDEEKKARIKRENVEIKPGSRVKREAQGKLAFTAAGEFELPPLNLLSEPKKRDQGSQLSDDVLEHNARRLESVLNDFGIRGEIVDVRPGPVVTLYELEPAPGIKSSRVIGLADDIARSMAAVSARVAVVPGRNAIGIELPNTKREKVVLRELLSSEDYESSTSKLPLILGKTIGGEPVIADLAAMPHLLVAGTTGSGKSVSINTMILSLLYRLTPEQCRLIMVDPKMLELSVYEGIPHLLAPVVTEPKKAVVALKWVVREMEDRYRKMSKMGVRNIRGFNEKITEAEEKGEQLSRTVQTGFDRETGEPIYETEEMNMSPMPYIVVVVDEMADLMIVAGKDVEASIQRLAQMARAAGIHLIMATQRPSVDVITGTIKANFPTRISFQVTSKIDSRTILGEQGAEQLLGMGDMLYMAGGGRIRRVHGPFVSDGEVEDVVAHLQRQGAPEYLNEITTEPEDGETDMLGLTGGGEGSGDDLFDQAVAIVARDRKASTSYIQRKLQIGYNRAARLIERMEQEGMVSEANHAGKREILLPEQEEM